MAEEFEVGGHTYTVKKMDARTQLKLSKRLAPILKALLDRRDEVLMANVLSTLHELSDEDLDFVLDLCLLYLLRKNPQGMFGPVMVQNGGIMHNDIREDPMLQLELAGIVIREDLGDFFQAVGTRILGAPAAMDQTSNTLVFPTERTGSSGQ
jgi:hypothetical protein